MAWGYTGRLTFCPGGLGVQGARRSALRLILGSDASVWYVYVLWCGDDSLYTGMTKDVVRRVHEHQSGRGARYTRAHLPVRLGAAWRFPSRSEASSAEIRFKRLARSRKLGFVRRRLSFLDAPFADATVEHLEEGDL